MSIFTFPGELTILGADKTLFNFQDIANSPREKIEPEVLQGPVENLLKDGYMLIDGNWPAMGLCSEGKRVVYAMLTQFLGSESTVGLNS
jgi:hypothetical protein